MSNFKITGNLEVIGGGQINGNEITTLVEKVLNNMNTNSEALTQSSIKLNQYEIKFGSLAVGSGTSKHAVNFDRPFNTACVFAIVGRLMKAYSNSYCPTVLQGTLTASGFQYEKQSASDRGVTWLAIGF